MKLSGPYEDIIEAAVQLLLLVSSPLLLPALLLKSFVIEIFVG